MSNMSGGNIKALIQALPEYRAMLGLLSTHISISEQLKNISEQRQLMEVGELEQDIVYGEKSSQELIKYLAGMWGGYRYSAKRGACYASAVCYRWPKKEIKGAQLVSGHGVL